MLTNQPVMGLPPYPHEYSFHHSPGADVAGRNGAETFLEALLSREMQCGFEKFARLAEVLAGSSLGLQDDFEFIRPCARRVWVWNIVSIVIFDFIEPRLLPENRTASLAGIMLRAGTTDAFEYHDVIVSEFSDKGLRVTGQERTVDSGLYHGIQHSKPLAA